MDTKHDHFMRQALTLARQGVSMGHGGPFGAIVVVEGKIIGQGWNQVVYRNDPTAHAEVLAIREACAETGSFHLSNATLYTTCEPCPMCMGAAYWAHIENLFYGATGDDAASAGFDDSHIQDELRRPLKQRDIHVAQRLHKECRKLLQQWTISDHRIVY